MSALEPGDLYVERYRIVARLGKPGGFGEVFLVEDTAFPGWPREALKRLRLDRDPTGSIGRYIDREIVTMKELSVGHPGIPTINNYGRGPQGEPYFTMEYVEGAELKGLLEAPLPLQEERVLRLLRDILDVLTYVHARGYAHRDLKPGNVIVAAPETPNERAKVIDFGIASIKKEAGTIAGTPGYMDLGQVSQDEVDPAMDLFALGVMAAKMVAKIPEPVVPDELLADPPAARRDLERRVQKFTQDFREAQLASPGTEQLILSLLDLDRGRRPSAQAALRRVTAQLQPKPSQWKRAVVVGTVIVIATSAWFGRCWLGLCAEGPSEAPASQLELVSGDEASRFGGERPRVGWLRVESDPRGAQVRLGTGMVGNGPLTPWVSGPITPGPVTIRLTRNGFEMRDTTIAVPWQDTAVVVVRMFACKKYELRTFPAAEVYADGNSKGLTNAFGIGRTVLCPGEHVFRVVPQSGEPWEVTYTVTRGDPCTGLVLDTPARDVQCLKSTVSKAIP